MNKAVSKKEEQAMALPEDLVLPKGAGLEGADRDSFAIPFLVILQKGTPQADADHEEYIEGSKPGMLLDTVANELIDTDQELVEAIPVFYRRAFIEWKTREDGGGFVSEHSVEDAAKMSYSRDEKNRDILFTFRLAVEAPGL